MKKLDLFGFISRAPSSECVDLLTQKKTFTYTVRCNFPTIWIHAWKKMDPGWIYQFADLLIATDVFLTNVIRQMKKQLSTQNLIAVHVGDEFHLRFH